MNKCKIAIYIQNPISEAECATALFDVCSKKYETKFLNHRSLTKKNLETIDCIAFPGGLGDADNFDFLLRDKKKLIKKYISEGGKYLGICMGAYLAGRHYFDILEDADCFQYTRRKNSEIKQEKETIINVRWKNKYYDMFFYDGCAIIGDERKFKVYSRYQNSDPMAVVQKNVGLIGCHPESPKNWYEDISAEHKWNNGKNHRLLINFIDNLLCR
jgi:glutamine amidotransferase-like uncharacterized protein